VCGANVKEWSKGSSAEETHSEMEGKYGGRAEEQRGEARKD
jgi:hypothetical protein